MPGISVSKICVPFTGGAGGPDAAPSALIVTGMRDTEIDFEWIINSTNHDGHRVYISTDGVTYTEEGTTTGADNTYTATGLTAGTLYYFYVVAYKGGLESAATDIYDTRFKITVDTTKAGSANNTFVLPNFTSGTYDYYVDWGEGGAEENITTTGNHTHEYAASGTYQIKIRGTMPRLFFNGGGDRLKVMTIDNWGNIKWSSMSTSLYGCANMEAQYIDVPNTSAVLSFNGMFRDCAKFDGNVLFDTANGTDMAYMFYGCVIFNKSVSSWDTTKVVDMTRLFSSCSLFNQPVNHFNTANVTSMAYMFAVCKVFNQSVSNWNTAKVTSMVGMFNTCWVFNQSVANFNTAEVLTMASMFYQCYVFNQSLATFNTAKVTTFLSMFEAATIFNQDISGWNVEAVTTMADMFKNSNALSTANYDALLIAWAAQSVNSAVPAHFGDATYTPGGGGGSGT